MSFPDYGGALELPGCGRRVPEPWPAWVAELVDKGRPCPPKFGGFFYLYDMGVLCVSRCNRRYEGGDTDLSFFDDEVARAMLHSGRHSYGLVDVFVVARCDEDGNPYVGELLPEQPPVP